MGGPRRHQPPPAVRLAQRIAHERLAEGGRWRVTVGLAVAAAILAAAVAGVGSARQVAEACAVLTDGAQPVANDAGTVARRELGCDRGG